MACSTRRTTNAPYNVARTVCLRAWACACLASRKPNLWAPRRPLCVMSSRGGEGINKEKMMSLQMKSEHDIIELRKRRFGERFL